MVVLRALIICLLAYCSVAFAETIPATSNNAGTVEIDSSPTNTLEAVCAAIRPFPKGTCTDFVKPDGNASCGYSYGGACYEQSGVINYTCPSGYALKSGNKTKCVNSTPVYTCPTGQNWTLSGQSCTRPDCASGETRNASGICESACLSKAGQEAFAWLQYYTSGPSPWGPRCKDGCAVYQTGPVTHATMNPTGDRYAGGGFYVDLMKTQWTGQSCAVGDPGASTTAPPDKQPPSPKKPPPCSASEGVLTSSSGTIACVPEGTPGSNKPIVSKQKAVEAFPDGSTKTTETTTTRDPGTGVETKTVSVSTTAATGGGTGQAGTPGTTTGPTTSSGTTTGGDPTKPGDSDFCAKNPNLQICKGGMNEEATQKKVEESTKKLADAFSTEGFDPDSHFEGKSDASEEVKDQAGTKVDEFGSEFQKFGSANDPAASNYQSFREAMESGWFEPIVFTGCTPFSARIGTWTWNLDHCPTAEKISGIGAYCMWVLLAFSVFNMATREGR